MNSKKLDELVGNNQYSLNIPIILFGTGRSGTTIFMNALFRHRELAFFQNFLERQPEWMWTNYFRHLTDNSYYRFFPDKVRNPLCKLFLKPVEGYSIWNHLIGNEINFSKSFLDNRNPSLKMKNEVYTYIEELIEFQKRSRFAFKTTGPGRLNFLSQLFPDAHFIWVKRSFIPTLHSFLKVDFWQDRSTGKLWWKSEKVERLLKEYQHIKKDPILLTAFQLQAIISDIEQAIDELNLNVLQINYEEFAVKPKTILSTTFEFCSLDPDDDCFHFIDNNQIENRNKKDTDYFDEEKLVEIQKVRGLFTNVYNKKG